MFKPIPIINICLIIVLIAAGVFFGWPAVKSYIALEEELSLKSQEFQQKGEYFQGLAETFDKLSTYPEKIKMIDVALPTDPSVALMLDYLKQAALENGLSIASLNVVSAGTLISKTSSSPKISISFSLSGPYAAFKNFLLSVYKNSRLIEIDSIKFSAATSGSSAEIAGKKPVIASEAFTFDLSISVNSFASASVSQKSPAAPKSSE